MFVVGAILIVLAIIVVIYVTFATSGLDPLLIDWGPFTAALTPVQLFFLGAVTILVLSIGAVMFSIGLKTQGAKRAEVKQLRKEVKKAHSDQPQRDSGTSATPRSGPPASDSPSKSPAKEGSDRKAAPPETEGEAGRGSSSAGSSGNSSQTRTSKLPPPVPPRDSTPPPRSGV